LRRAFGCGKWSQYTARNTLKSGESKNKENCIRYRVNWGRKNLAVSIQEIVVTEVGIISVYCTSPPPVKNARHNALPEQTTFDLNTTLQYQCYRGYVTEGFSTAKCLELGSAASWFGPDFTCKREYIHIPLSDVYLFVMFNSHVYVTKYQALLFL
jgi:hypothetical protein